MNKIILAAAVSLVGSLYSQAQTVTTDPVGFVSVSVPAASDAALGAPLARASEYQGVIQSISGSQITVAGTPGWVASQFLYVSGSQPKTYYARIDSGVREGLIGTITANDATSITITIPTGDDLSGVLTSALNTTGDSISIAPYWTLATLISGIPAGTQVLTYPTNTAGVNLAAAATYVYTGTNWQQGATIMNDVILPPMQGFTLRNNSASPIVVSITGSVPMSTHRLIVRTLAASTKQDQRIFFNSPVPETIGNTGLGTAAGDQLLIIDNSTTGKNKANSVTLTWSGTKWFNGGTDVTLTYQLQPGSSYILRKAQTGSATNFVSSHLQSYLQ